MKEFNGKLWQKDQEKIVAGILIYAGLRTKYLFHFGHTEVLKLEVSLLLVQYFLGEKYNKGASTC